MFGDVGGDSVSQGGMGPLISLERQQTDITGAGNHISILGSNKLAMNIHTQDLLWPGDTAGRCEIHLILDTTGGEDDGGLQFVVPIVAHCGAGC